MKLAHLILLSSTALPAQSWFKVAAESTSTIVTLPAGTTYRFGAPLTSTANGCGLLGWLTATVITPTLVTPTAKKFVCDPAPNVTKELDILQTTSAQAITVTSGNKSTTIMVPLVLAPPPQPGQPSLIGTFTCIVNVYDNGTFSSTLCTKVGQ